MSAQLGKIERGIKIRRMAMRITMRRNGRKYMIVAHTIGVLQNATYSFTSGSVL